MRIGKNHFLTSRPIAHRGLWGNGVVENSLTAYQNAVNDGYPIEIDLYQSKDGVLFSFHDSTLKRMTGTDGYIYEKTAEELKSLRLDGTEEQIPTFEEVLSTVNSKVPLLIEIKDQPNGKIVVDKIVARLKKYDGAFALQSFNPLYINRVKKIAPEFLRGILATGNDDLKDKSFITRFIVKNMALNFLIKPDFISYIYTHLPLKKSKTKNKAVLAWTVTSQEVYDKMKSIADNIIFEGFVPQES